MKILLQDFVPYPQSFKWEIHHHYYQRRGSKAWLNREVPCHITSNDRAACQHATILYEILQQTHHTSTATVLEIGAGLGEFAIHFLNRFFERCQTQQTSFSIHYLFADFSRQTLEEAAQNPFLKKFQERGLLDFYVLDALIPESLQALNGNSFSLKESRPIAIIENYLHCTLPLTILKKKNQQFLEKYLSLSYEDASNSASRETIQAQLLQKATQSGTLPSLIEAFDYRPVDLSRELKYARFQKILEQACEGLDEATILFPFGSLQHLELFLPLLHPDGILIISDKGYPDASWMKGENEIYVQPSIHGNSLGHPVNLPFLEIFAREQGYRTRRTTNRKYYLQSLAIFPVNASRAGDDHFQDQFITRNLNQEAELFWLKAFEEKQKKDWRGAKALLLQCLEYRAQDCCLFYELGQLCLGLEEYAEALHYFQQGALFNYFQEHDFYFNQGKGYLGQRDFTNALNAFQTSMKYFPSYHYSSYNIGLVYEGMKNYRQALIYYQQALQPNPHDPQKLAPPDICMLVRRKRMFFLFLLPLVCFLLLLILIALGYWILGMSHRTT